MLNVSITPTIKSSKNSVGFTRIYINVRYFFIKCESHLSVISFFSAKKLWSIFRGSQKTAKRLSFFIVASSQLKSDVYRFSTQWNYTEIINWNCFLIASNLMEYKTLTIIIVDKFSAWDCYYISKLNKGEIFAPWKKQPKAKCPALNYVNSLGLN